MVESSSAPGSPPDGETVVLDGGLLSVPIDRSSLTVNDQGKMTVNEPSITVIGDFEQQMDGWSISGSFSATSYQASNAARGTYSFFIDQDVFDAQLGALERTVDLTNKERLKVEVTESNLSGVGAYFRIVVGGTTEVEKAGANTTSFTGSYDIDVSGYSGSTTIRIELEDQTNDNNFDIHGHIDDIRLTNSTKEVENL